MRLTEYELRRRKEALKLNSRDIQDIIELIDRETNYWTNEYENAKNEYDKDYAESCYKDYLKLRAKVENLEKLNEEEMGE